MSLSFLLIVERQHAAVCPVRRVVTPLHKLILRFEYQLALAIRVVASSRKLLDEPIVFRDVALSFPDKMRHVEPCLGDLVRVLTTIDGRATVVKLQHVLSRVVEFVHDALTHATRIRHVERIFI